MANRPAPISAYSSLHSLRDDGAGEIGSFGRADALDRTVNDLETPVNGATTAPITTANAVTASITETTERVAHGLGRTPLGWWSQRLDDGAGTITESRAPDRRYIYPSLNGAPAVTARVRFLVF